MKAKQYELTQAQEERVLQNMNLVYYLVKKNYCNHYQREDLEQIGMIGLIKASATFKEDKGIQFATYAARCILNEINMFLRSDKKFLSYAHFEDIRHVDSEGNDLTLGDVIEDPNSFDYIENSAMLEELQKGISILLNELPARISCMMLLTIAGLLQQEIADLFGLSQSYISRIIRKSGRRIKSFENGYKPTKEVFEVEIKNDKMVITFSTSDVANFREAVSRFLLNIGETKIKEEFEISYENGKAILQTWLDETSLKIVAMLIAELNNFQISYSNFSERAIEVSSSTVENKPVVKMSMESTRGAETVLQTHTSVPNKPKEKTAEPVIATVRKEKGTDSVEVQEKESKTGSEKSVVEETTNSPKVTELAIQNYAIQMQKFSLAQIREKFPNSSILELSIAINGLLRKNVIRIYEKGNYEVIK